MTTCQATKGAAGWEKAWSRQRDLGLVTCLTVPQRRCRRLSHQRVPPRTEITSGLMVQQGGGQVEITASATHWQIRGASIRTCVRVARFLPLPDAGEASIQYDSMTEGSLTVCDLPLPDLWTLLTRPWARLRRTLHGGCKGPCMCKGKVATGMRTVRQPLARKM